MDSRKVSVPFHTPVRMPNGLQWFDNELYVMDQLTDDVFVLDKDGNVKRVISTETQNGSGITVGGGFLWTASNGSPMARPSRQSDDHISKVLKLDLETGKTLGHFLTPDGGGIHGIEWDNGNIWITAFNPKSLILMDGSNFEVISQFPCNLEVLHGLAKDGDGIWCADRSEKVIVKFDKKTGAEIGKIGLPKTGPDPHGLTILDQQLWYSDADFPVTTRDGVPIEGLRGYPEIGFIL